MNEKSTEVTENDFETVCTDRAIAGFVLRMRERLHEARLQGKHGWMNESPAYLSERLYQALKDGDLVSVANYAMFLHHLAYPVKTALPDALTASQKHSLNILGDVRIALNKALPGWNDEEPTSGQTSEVKAIERLAGTTGNVNILVFALERLSKLGNGDKVGNSIGNQIAVDALNAFRESECISGVLSPLPDTPRVTQRGQAQAWHAVSKKLYEVDPDWIKKGNTGLEAAILCITELANNKPKGKLQRVLTLDQVKFLVDMLTLVAPGTVVSEEVLAKSAKLAYVEGEKE